MARGPNFIDLRNMEKENVARKKLRGRLYPLFALIFAAGSFVLSTISLILVLTGGN